MPRGKNEWVEGLSFEILEEGRKVLGLRKLGMANLLGVTNSTYHNWKRGGVPNTSCQIKIQDILASEAAKPGSLRVWIVRCFLVSTGELTKTVLVKGTEQSIRAHLEEDEVKLDPRAYANTIQGLREIWPHTGERIIAVLQDVCVLNTAGKRVA